MAKQVSPGVLALRKVVDDVHKEAREAKARGELVGWSSSKFPCELAAAFDLHVMYPLNQLRTARGLTALTADDVKDDVTLLDGTKISGLFNAIQEERGREMLAEGTRLFDLKRWGQGFKRDINAKLAPLVDQVSYLQTMKQTAGSPKFVWPIPNSELTQNPNFGSQNQGYL